MGSIVRFYDINGTAKVPVDVSESFRRDTVPFEIIRQLAQDPRDFGSG